MRPEFITLAENRSHSCDTNYNNGTDLLYMASAYADAATRTSGDWYPYYSNFHNIETILVLAV